MKKTSLGLAAALLQLPLVALAQTAPPSNPSPAITLGETVVTATRTAQALSELVADVTVIDREEIERAGAVGVADLLARQPGIEISRNGGVGTATSVFMRGAESRFAAVFVDGIRVDSQSTGGAVWESIPWAQIERIEILRGPAAAVYGSDAIGGVIQLFTRRGEGAAKPYLGIGLGSRGLRSAQAGLTGSAGAFDYSVNAAYEESRGFDARTPAVKSHNPDNDSYRTSSASVRLGYQVAPGQRVEVLALDNILNSGYDDFSYNPKKPVDDRNKLHLSTLGLKWTAQWNDAYRTTVSVSDSTSRYETYPSPYITRTKLRSYLFQNEYRFGAHLVTAALERREDRLFNPALDEYSTTIDRKRSQDALALGYAFNQGRHSVQLNLRHDRDSDFGGKSTGSAAYGYSFAEGWRATVSAASAFRAPTLYQRFSQYGVAGLQPETSRNVEVGVRYADELTTASLVAYNNRVRDLITFDYESTGCASNFGCYANVDHAVYRGVTLSASRRLGDVTLRGSLDVQDPHNAKTGKLLALRARHHASFGADWRVGTWTLGAEWLFSSHRFADAANKTRLPGYGTVNLSATTPIAADVSVVARLDNVGDKKYELANSYATAGRTFYVGLKWQPK